MYTPDDFNLDNAPKEMVQFIIDHVDDFEFRYALALDVIGIDRCPLYMADYTLNNDIVDAMEEWCYDNNKDPDSYDIEEIFG